MRGASTQASLANHSCSVRQIGQYEREKNTGMELNRAGSISYCVHMLCPVSGHRIISIPILVSMRFRLTRLANDLPIRGASLGRDAGLVQVSSQTLLSVF
jgi:hypothetical protein